MPPPIVPGIQDKNSNPPILFSIAKSENALSVTLLPAIIMFSFNIEIFLKLLPSLITTPSKIPSVIKIFEPAPIEKIFPLFLYNFRKDINSFKDSGLKKILDLPPILNQLILFKE